MIDLVDYTLLGTGGGMPLPERNLSALLISFNGRKILVDCGEGTQVSMKMVNSGFKTIDVICISHVHGDHIIGLPGLLGTIGNSGRKEPVTIIGPSGITEAVNGLMVIAKYLPYEVNIIENPKEDMEIIKDVNLSFIELCHSSPCIGYSFYFKRKPKFNVEMAMRNNVPKMLWNKLQNSEDKVELDGKDYTKEMVLGEERRGIKLSFVTDTRPIDEIVPFIEHSDLFLCEGTYGRNEDIEKAIKNKHMTFAEAADLAKRSNVKEMILTHFSEAMLNPEEYIGNAREIFENSVVGYDRYCGHINFGDV